MKNAKTRLGTCFLQVFPSLNEETVSSASEDTVQDWDSVHLISLVLSIETEFGKNIPDERLQEITSFSKTLKLVESL